MILLRTLFSFAASLLMAGAALASSLTFEKTIVPHTAEPDAKQVEVLFPFKNASDEVVVIKKFDAPCSCMNAMIKGGKTLSNGVIEFQPGDKGVIKGIFRLENFKGTVDKKIKIWTGKDSDKSPSISLTTRVTIPILMSVQPASLSWDVGGEAGPKEFSVKVNSSEAMKIVRHSLSNPHFEYLVETVKDGFEYKVTVTPKDTSKVAFGALRLYTDSSIQRYKLSQGFVTVKKRK